ncbi:MAG TPA: histidinol-phosphate transaminase [Actinomycetales bacterium]|nr:histidinol-phosphate transaminase [Actinomycetales bacterium]
MSGLEEGSKAAFNLPIRPELAGETPYGAPQIDVPVQLNVNENPYGPTPEIIADIAEEVTSAAATLNRYPDREFRDLRAQLAGFLASESDVSGLDIDNIWAANGSNEIMLHLFQAFGGPGRTALTFTPSYSMYPEYARDTLTRFATAPRQDDFRIDLPAARAEIARLQPSLVLLTSPNNPTGTALEIETVQEILDAAAQVGSGCLVVVDEAYAEFRRAQTPSALRLLRQSPNLVVTRTMSKAFALAGARLGYLAASRQVVDALRIVRLPYHLSAITQAVARTALRHSTALLASVAHLRAERDATVAWLRESGYEVAASDANFVYFGRFEDRHALWQALLARGVLIRETGPDGWLRVSIGTPDEMCAFKSALVEVTQA